MDIYVKYQIGKSCFTKSLPIEQNFLAKQVSGLPLITGALIHLPINKDIRVIVGKEINLDHIAFEKEKIANFNLNLDDLASLSLKGYRKACILNFKNESDLVVGINEDDIVVSDIMSLKKIVDSFCVKEDCYV